MSIREYRGKSRDRGICARDKLDFLVDYGSDVATEEGEGDMETMSPRRKESSVGSGRLREDDSDASSSKRPRRDSERPLANAGLLSSSRGGDDSTSSGAVTSRNNPVRDRWMLTRSEIVRQLLRVRIIRVCGPHLG
ncbi:hypothetical protein PF005_g1970 [Phytophthora fragariae]|uniref:Uncharacterized protein n=1 Tax=Phytophthora fragariae TaxID=53985 RepID=A0A6A4EJZ7_9STRA|nr:hypothetical protein PF003_g22344 [Phytophthora fragariae]KAE8948558.1 hypothetical protein PF009_g1883 [Phytophthora fragariae]KAE9028569.1 hypothetical protein PF011_g1515 [Phytophthora fragariae]KAE9138140.1 hypothetical protein PF007_g1531 [Phytophthora fragariae]KAE9153835.1 hypothetical protein PF006_g2087 [Phytophthora fragariae]